MSKLCPNCNRILKPTLVSINNKEEIKLKCRYCNFIEGLEEEIRKNPQKAIPKECPDCESKKIILESIDKKGNIQWECKDCKSIFKWKKYIAIFCVEVTYEAIPEDAEDYAWEFKENGEPELIGYWENGKYNANIQFTKKKRAIKREDNIREIIKEVI